jgi:hypothetical protein
MRGRVRLGWCLTAPTTPPPTRTSPLHSMVLHFERGFPGVGGGGCWACSMEERRLPCHFVTYVHALGVF